VATPPEVAQAQPRPDADPSDDASSDQPGGPSGTSGFEVHLDVFSGPFDLLLGLIAKHKLDITEVALSQVTDEFLGYLRAVEADGWDLSQASEFLVVAATLLDLKAARLLPTGDVEDAEDLELLEARDLLFARLLQYRAYKEIAATLRQRWADGALSRPRSVTLEPQLAVLLPELVWTLGPDQLAALAAQVLAPRPAPPGVDLSHLHVSVVSVREQAAVLADRLRRHASVSFRVLTADAGSTLVVVARFLALLELYREGAVAFDQVVALGDLTVRWTGSEAGEVNLTTDYDDGPGEPGSGGPEEPMNREAS
jgi:segregation and condensation protein A